MMKQKHALIAGGGCMSERAAANAYYSHVVWRHLHGGSCRCLLCGPNRTERERVPSFVDWLDVVLALWVAEAGCEER